MSFNGNGTEIAFMDFGKGAGMEFSNGKGREREFDAGIPGNCGEREFPLTPDSAQHLCHVSHSKLILRYHAIPRNSAM